MDPTCVKVRVPASIGNVGPGFDVLGLAVDGLYDELSMSLTTGEPRIVSVQGRDADHVPKDFRGNCAAIAALSYLRRIGETRVPQLHLFRGLPIAGGLGSSAAASVAGAFAAALASGRIAGATIAEASAAEVQLVLEASLDGEAAVAGRHLDNIAPVLFGGLCLVASTEPAKVHRLPILGSWWLALATPTFALRTRDARAVLPDAVSRSEFVTQLGHVAGVVAAFASGDYPLMRQSLHDAFAEPRRAGLIPGFHDAQRAALARGALGCSISGAGPTVFALASDETTAQAAAKAIKAALGGDASIHIGQVAATGVSRS